MCLAQFFSEPLCLESPEELCGHNEYHIWQDWAYQKYDVNTLSIFLRMRLGPEARIFIKDICQ
jgi:hypothetical protein